MTRPKKRIAYTIKQHVAAHNLGVLYSANAWWMNEVKVNELLAAFRIEATIPEACLAARITLRQYKYFARLHPVINELRKDYHAMNQFTARKTIVRALSSDGRMVRWYLERALPEEFGNPSRQRAAEGRKDRTESINLMRAGVARNRDIYSSDPRMAEFSRKFESFKMRYKLDPLEGYLEVS